jgi:hypothetical protein
MSAFQNHSKSLVLSLILVVIFCSSCTKHKSKLAEYGSVFESVMISDSCVFRGINLGDKLNSIQAKEKNKPIETDTGYLYYEYSLDSTGSYSITYNFDETGLNEIQSDIFIKNPDKSDQIFSMFKSYFDEHYGDSESHQGFTVWSAKSEKYGDVKISLSDESADFTVDKAPAKLSLWIYPDRD